MDGKLQYCQYMSAGCAHTVYVPTSSGCCVLLLQISSCVLGRGGGGYTVRMLVMELCTV